ncbi:uncharacterized protein YicC (UPF0701 family) [Catalinimonas alkaloidigena]|uniref:hypothetical protein n=1 Tax=Catalinimonas alkaloidigena TaxID=1075417 RepID=UPI0024060F20|nr:hypothetical protein [Catalinimonas alkaloidigena]MDF9799816.1 uncharacterized protein YicC (UPF0701 family) [Catalinimonas alkaloidigena]
MTDIEFDVLDELYFVIGFNQLQQELDIGEDTLKETLRALLNKGWIKCFLSVGGEAVQGEIDFDNKYKKYYYLASKTGLLAHNGRM